jgi:hypothetical protein
MTNNVVVSLRETGGFRALFFASLPLFPADTKFFRFHVAHGLTLCMWMERGLQGIINFARHFCVATPLSVAAAHFSFNDNHHYHIIVLHLSLHTLLPLLRVFFGIYLIDPICLDRIF